MKNILKGLITLVALVLLVGGTAYTLFQDSTNLSYHQIEKNEKALTIGEYLEKEKLLSSLRLTPETRKSLGETRKFIVKSNNEPPINSGDVLLSFGGYNPDNQLHILFTNTKP